MFLIYSEGHAAKEDGTHERWYCSEQSRTSTSDCTGTLHWVTKLLFSSFFHIGIEKTLQGIALLNSNPMPRTGMNLIKLDHVF